MAHRDCDHCESTDPVTHRVTPWVAGERQEHLHAYLCPDCAEKHRQALHVQGYGCVEIRPVRSMEELSAMAAGEALDLGEAVVLEDVPERNVVWVKAGTYSLGRVQP